MADKEANVQVEEDGVVLVDVSGDPDLAAAAEADAGADPEPKPAAKPAVAKPAAAAKPSAADEAAVALQQALKMADGRVSAAEATALAERRRADEATRVAAARDTEAKTLREQTENQELSILTTGIDAAQREVETQQAEMERALEAGEFPKVSAAQVKLSKAAAALDRLQDAKATFEAGARKSAATTEGRVEAQPQQISAFEQYVSGFAPPAQAWLRQHPDYVPASVGGDATKNAKMMKGHYAALEQGLVPNTPDYFRVIEETTGDRTPVSAAATVIEAGSEEAPAVAAAPKPAAKRQPQVSAPVSRDAPSAQGLPQATVRLTPEQQEIALLSTTPRQIVSSNGQVVHESDADYRKRAFGAYAHELLKAKAEGKIGRLTH